MGCYQSRRGTVRMPRRSGQTVISSMHYSTTPRDLCSSHSETHWRGNRRNVLWSPEAISQHSGRYPTSVNLSIHGINPVLDFSLFWQWKNLNIGGIVQWVLLCSTYQSHLMGIWKETALFWICLWAIFCSVVVVCACVCSGLQIHYANYRWQSVMTPACYVSTELASEEGHGPHTAACVRSHTLCVCVRSCHRHP